METDEKGVLTQAELEEAWDSASWSGRLAGLQAIAHAQHDHDVAVVNAVENPYPDSWEKDEVHAHKAAEVMRQGLLAALKAKADG